MPEPKTVLITEVVCPLCGAEAALRHGSFPGYAEGATFRIYSCPGCEASFVDPRRLPHGLYDRLYELGSGLPGYGRYARYARLAARTPDPLEFLARTEDTYWGVAQSLAGLHPASTSLLEIGAGLGYLTYALSRRGYDTRGIDISSSAVRRARELFGNLFVEADLPAYAAEHSATYDAVIACELIEHLEDPIPFLRTAASLVKPGGRLIVTTPNRSLYGADAIWESDSPPVHFWWFSERSVEVLARSIGTRVSFVDFEPFQAEHPLFIHNAPTTDARRPFLTASLEPTARAKGARRRGRMYESLRLISQNEWLQNRRGRHRVTGARRAVLCAVMTRGR